MSPITPSYIQSQIAKGKKYVLVLKKIGPNRGHSLNEAYEWFGIPGAVLV